MSSGICLAHDAGISNKVIFMRARAGTRHIFISRVHKYTKFYFNIQVFKYIHSDK
jgi:hypothetical protein